MIKTVAPSSPHLLVNIFIDLFHSQLHASRFSNFYTFNYDSLERRYRQRSKPDKTGTNGVRGYLQKFTLSPLPSLFQPSTTTHATRYGLATKCMQLNRQKPIAHSQINAPTRLVLSLLASPLVVSPHSNLTLRKLTLPCETFTVGQRIISWRRRIISVYRQFGLLHLERASILSLMSHLCKPSPKQSSVCLMDQRNLFP